MQAELMRKTFYTCKHHGGLLREEVYKGGTKDGKQQWRCVQCMKANYEHRNRLRREKRAEKTRWLESKKDAIRHVRIGVINRLEDAIHTIQWSIEHDASGLKKTLYEDELIASKILYERLCDNWEIRKTDLQSTT